MYVYIYIYIYIYTYIIITYIYIYIYIHTQGLLRGWRNTLEIVLIEISNAMKLHPYVCVYTCMCIYIYIYTHVFHAYASKLRPVIGLLDPKTSRRGFQPYPAGLPL